MGLQTTITVTCDYPGCTNGPNGSPASVSYVKELVEREEKALPEEAKYLVMFNQGQGMKTFCGQLHASAFFMPPGFTLEKAKVTPFPVQPDSPINGQFCKCPHPVSYHGKWGCTERLSKEPGDFCKCEVPGPEVAA